MQYLERISEIERRASEINLSLGRICRSAKVPVSTVWRWKGRIVSPTQRSIDLHLGRLERLLETEEKRVRSAQ